MRVFLKIVPLERWIQFMIDGFKTVSLAWVNKIAVIGYTWPFFVKALVGTRGESMLPQSVQVRSY